MAQLFVWCESLSGRKLATPDKPTWSDRCPMFVFMLLALVDVAPSVSELEEEITPKELEEIEVALEEIAVEKEIHIEEDQIQDLREDMQEYKEVNINRISYLFIGQSELSPAERGGYRYTV